MTNVHQPLAVSSQAPFGVAELGHADHERFLSFAFPT
jgi:hypothetical protein